MTITGEMTPFTPRQRQFNRRVGGNIRRARKAAGVTQRALADAIGYERAQMCRVEKGKAAIAVTRFLRLAARLGVPAVSLLPRLPKPRLPKPPRDESFDVV
jgi:transcriptional regulator with XRE-family HTH domain